MLMKFPYGKNVLLTGGSSGIGLATSELFAQSGYTVFAASRNPISENVSYANGGEIRPVTLDVCDPHSVNSALEPILSQADIGVVIHCAGIGIACPGEEFPSSAVAKLMETNYNGVLRVNSCVLPQLRRRGAGLCIIVGSLAAIFPIPFQSHYCAAKAALDSYAAALRMELASYGVHVCLLMPGDTNTGFTSARSYEIGESSVYYDACLKAVQRMEEDERKGRPPISVARAILRLSSRIKPPLRTIVGFEYKLLAFLKRFLPDKLIAKILMSIYVGR